MASPPYSTRIISGTLKPIPIARRSAMRSWADAADDRVVHVEVGVDQCRHRVADVAHAPLGEIRAQLAAGQQPLCPATGQEREVEVASLEGEDLGDLLLDDVELDATDGGQPRAGHGGREGLQRGIADGGERDVAVPGARHEHELRSALPLRDPVGPGAHGVRRRIAARCLDHLARHGVAPARGRGPRGACNRPRQARSAACASRPPAAPRSGRRSRTGRCCARHRRPRVRRRRDR